MRTTIFPNGLERMDLYLNHLGMRLQLFHHDDYINDSISDRRKRVVWYVVVEQTVDGKISWVELEKNDKL